jgi:hypothetical protein
MLDASVTAGDVADRLRNPVAWTRKALDALYVARRRHPDAVLRIGVKGNGSYPNYRIDADPASARLLAAYNGRTYGELTGKDSLAEENWSRASTDLAGMQRLLRETAERHRDAA